MRIRTWIGYGGIALLLIVSGVMPANACTGIVLQAENGGSVYGRTMEWGSFDLNSRLVVIPQGHPFQGMTPDGKNGKKWKATYGVVGLDMLKKDMLADGMNEAGLSGGLFYHPNVATYPAYQKSKAKKTITAVDLLGYILTRYATLAEVREGLENVRVVPVVEEAIGIPVEAHWIITEASGKSMVIEFIDKKLRFFENPLGVITNAPTYDWHMTNLRNYVNLSAVALPSKKIEELDFAPLGGGSGMIGLPGDFTPPSRFIRAVAWSQTARPTGDTGETVYELFRILDNFNIPLGAAEGADTADADTQGMRSATLWTTAWDHKEMVFYYHTQHNRRVRKVDLKKVDFSGDSIRRSAMDAVKAQDTQDVTPR